eukprot:TRINITY_DN23964_c1_g1_i1.p1 TRINITY_DN23964_c1_g1~~TRINITY_DN23964_c1_g1_i1.p1  ORF type:complete len:901 (+),score=134.92 TRINITY_DN23964_c1_g1_i1:114-2816(+)
MNSSFSNLDVEAASAWDSPDSQPMRAASVLVLWCTFLIISMQLGFAMLEVGSVREEHRMTVLVKNMIDSVVSCLTFALACEIGAPSLVLDEHGVAEKHMLLFHWSFLGTCVTICSGSMAERTHLFPYLCYAVVMSGVVYPMIADGAWGKGSALLHHQFHNVFGTGYTYRDYAGSGVVHLAGGTAALAGHIFLGRRIMKPQRELYNFNADGELSTDPAPSLENADTYPSVHCMEEGVPAEDERLKDALFMGWQRRFDNVDDDDREFRANSYLQVLGMFNLWVGWYGFNTASAFAKANGDSVWLASYVAWNTTLGATSGALGSFLNFYLFQGSINIGFLCNGVISGLVAITSCCDVASPLAAGLIGFVAGFIVYPVGSHLLENLKIDDPVDAIPVHAGCGFFGLLASAFCAPMCSEVPFRGMTLCSKDYNMGLQFVAQAWGAMMIFWCTFGIMAMLWTFFTFLECIRMLEVEHLAMAYKHAGMILQEGGHESSLSQSCEPEIWKQIAANSRTARFLLKDVGWKGESFAPTDADAIEVFRGDILEAIQDKTKTALELNTLPVRTVLCLAKSFAHLRFVRELGRLRLRISPFAELSGLGVTASDDGQVAHAMKSVLRVVSDIRTAQSATLPLQMEVDQLTRHVQSQGLLLQRLTRSRRPGGKLPVARLSSVPEVFQNQEQQKDRDNLANGEELQESHGRASTPPPMMLPRSMPMPKSRGRDLHSEAGRSRDLTPEERTIQPNRTSVRSETASTVSDRSMCLLTPRSAGDDTPPPTLYGNVLGRSSSPRSFRSELRPELQGQQIAQGMTQQVQVPQADAIASQLLTMLQAQEHLMSALNRSDAQQLTGGMTQFRQELLQAMQRQGLEHSRPSSSRSSRSIRSRASFDMHLAPDSSRSGSTVPFIA